jgi:magnesium transporter
MNVTVPRNNNGEYWLFAVTLVFSLCTQIGYLMVVRYWWVKAKRRPRVVLK